MLMMPACGVLLTILACCWCCLQSPADAHDARWLQGAGENCRPTDVHGACTLQFAGQSTVQLMLVMLVCHRFKVKPTCDKFWLTGYRILQERLPTQNCRNRCKFANRYRGSLDVDAELSFWHIQEFSSGSCFRIC